MRSTNVDPELAVVLNLEVLQARKAVGAGEHGRRPETGVGAEFVDAPCDLQRDELFSEQLHSVRDVVAMCFAKREMGDGVGLGDAGEWEEVHHDIEDAEAREDVVTRQRELVLFLGRDLVTTQ